MTDMFWLHVPLQTDRDEWLEARGYEQFEVLGQPTKLIEFNLEMAPWSLDFKNSVIRHARRLPQVSDERLLAAIDLMGTVRYETLHRSAFLTYLTILDSLADRFERGSRVVAWIEEKIDEAKEFNDQSLISAIGNLKRSSHGSAIRGAHRPG